MIDLVSASSSLSCFTLRTDRARGVALLLAVVLGGAIPAARAALWAGAAKVDVTMRTGPVLSLSR